MIHKIDDLLICQEKNLPYKKWQGRLTYIFYWCIIIKTALLFDSCPQNRLIQRVTALCASQAVTFFFYRFEHNKQDKYYIQQLSSAKNHSTTFRNHPPCRGATANNSTLIIIISYLCNCVNNFTVYRQYIQCYRSESLKAFPTVQTVFHFFL